MKRTIIARAAWKVLLADGSKWDSPSTVQFRRVEGLQRVGDRCAARAGRAGALRRAGVRVHCVGSLRGLLKAEAEIDES